MWQYFQSVAQIYSRSFKTKSLCQFFFYKTLDILYKEQYQCWLSKKDISCGIWVDSRYLDYSKNKWLWKQICIKILKNLCRITLNQHLDCIHQISFWSSVLNINIMALISFLECGFKRLIYWITFLIFSKVAGLYSLLCAVYLLLFRMTSPK